MGVSLHQHTIVKFYSSVIMFSSILSHVYPVMMDVPSSGKSLHTLSSKLLPTASSHIQSVDGDALRPPTSKQHNNTDVEVSMERIPADELHWKNQVVIACTITVAMEMLMILWMIVCWRQIRWTLLKLACSCRCCHQRRTATRLQGNDAPDIDMESDVDNNSDASPSVHLYMPVEHDAAEGIDSVANDTWHNATLEPYRHLHVAGPSYTQLQCVPQHTRSQPWHVFNDSSDSSGDDEPLVELGRVFVPVQSAAVSVDVERSSNLLASACHVDNCSHVGGVESGVSSRQNND